MAEPPGINLLGIQILQVAGPAALQRARPRSWRRLRYTLGAECHLDGVRGPRPSVQRHRPPASTDPARHAVLRGGLTVPTDTSASLEIVDLQQADCLVRVVTVEPAASKFLDQLSG